MNDLVFLTVIAFVLAIAIGANDETWATVVGIKKLSVNQSVLFGSLAIIIGAVTIGFNVAKTVGTDISESPFTTAQSLTILLSVALILILGSWKGLPLSTTHATVGATIAITLIIGEQVNARTIQKILISWVTSPILGFVGAYIITKLVLKLKRRWIRGLDDVDRTEMMFSNLLIVAVAFTSISRGGNDVSNAIAPIIAAFISLGDTMGNSLIARLPLLLGGIGMSIGLIIIGRRVLKTLGNDVVNLSPTSAVSIQLATALVTLTAGILGIPISGTHVLVAAFIGGGMAYEVEVNIDTVKKIAISAVGTPIVAFVTTLVMWGTISLFL